MNIAILGTGNMGRALIAGMRRKYGEEIHIVAYDRKEGALKGLDPTVAVVEPEYWFSAKSVPDAVIVAVKPADVASALSQLAGAGGEKALAPLWISIVAGKTIAALQALLPAGARICRVMPNTPALIGQGMSAYALSDNAAAEDTRRAEKIFSACGKVLAVSEKLMNAVTGLSGSGPAYVFYFLESLIEAGVLAGLPQDVARTCALQTVIGAAHMADEAAEGLPELKMKVMTPAGTTARAFMALEQHGFKDAIIKAVIAATKRADELSQ